VNKSSTENQCRGEVMALEQGSVDVAFNWWNSDSDSNLTRMVSKGMVRRVG
jgi:phosphonate transport system substrate-binding protein